MKQTFIVLFISCSIVIGAAVLFTHMMQKKAAEMGIHSTPSEPETAPTKAG